MTRVLVVDDERRIVNFISRALSAAGLGVDGASDGEQGLALAQSGIYALLILDLRLPGLDGVSVLRELMKSHPEQQVLVLSGMSDTKDRVQCLRLGAADYVTKPFALAELTARVERRLTEHARRRREVVSSTSRVVLDPQRRFADAGRGRVHLSEHEFMLLQHLIDHVGEVCTRGDLLADIWGFTFDPGSNLVEVLVSRLRAKLGREVIETVRHVGYTLRDG